MKSLKDQIDAAYKKKVTEPHEQLIRKTGLMVLANVSLSTPVKTGRARGNWNMSIDTVDGTTTDNTSAPDLAAAAEKLKGFYIGKTIYVSNNLPYIKRLNDGYSKQAPANFVETGVALAKLQAKGDV